MAVLVFRYLILLEKSGKLFGENFKPLIDFMPLSEYNFILQDCGIVIMNHKRQQAFGNIIISLWMGAKVYLNKENTIYQYLKRISVVVFSIEQDLKQDNENIFTLLSQEDQNHNRKTILSELNKEKLMTQLTTQISSILDD